MGYNSDVRDRLEEQRDQADAWIESESREEQGEEVTGKKRKKFAFGGKKFKLSLMKRMMLTSLGPLLFMGIVVTTYAIMMLQSSLKDQKADSLLYFAMSVRSSIDSSSDGGLNEQDGKLYIGSKEIGSNKAFLDEYTNKGEIQLTLYYGTDSRLTTIVDGDGKKIDIGTADKDVVSSVIRSGKAYSTDNDKLGGKKYYSVYIPVKNNGKVVGMLCASQPKAEVDKLVGKQIRSLASIAIVILLVAAVIVGGSSYSTAKATKKMEESLSALADGYLSITVSMSTLRRDDEIGVMARALQKTAKRMTDVVHEINSITSRLVKAGMKLEESSEETAETANGISNAFEKISEGAATQAGDVVCANESVSLMGEGITTIIDSLQSLSDSTNAMLVADKESEKIVAKLVDSTYRTTEAINEVSNKVNDTDRAVDKIREAVSIITNIADETSLLSLNASIEAARAGEAGRGFSVVAIQIQKLAEMSAKSAERIEETIEELSMDSHAAVNVMNEIDDIMKEQMEMLALTQKHFEAVSDGISAAINETNTIQGQSQSCDRARNEVMDTIQSLSTVSEENAQSTEATTASMEDLNRTINLFTDSAKNLQTMAVKLEENVKFFKL